MTTRLIKYTEQQRRGKSLVDFYNNTVLYPISPNNIQKETDPDWIYMMYSTDSKLYKIGITCDPKTRLWYISRNLMSNKLRIVEAIQMQIGFDASAKIIERIIFQYFKSKRIFGEWYKFDKRDLVNLRQLMYAIEGEDNWNAYIFTIKPFLN